MFFLVRTLFLFVFFLIHNGKNTLTSKKKKNKKSKGKNILKRKCYSIFGTELGFAQKSCYNFSRLLSQKNKMQKKNVTSCHIFVNITANLALKRDRETPSGTSTSVNSILERFHRHQRILKIHGAFKIPDNFKVSLKFKLEVSEDKVLQEILRLDGTKSTPSGDIPDISEC